MSEETQLDRIERRQDDTYKLVHTFIVEQTKRNGEYDAHLKNHSKVNKILSWIVATGISLGVIKNIGG